MTLMRTIAALELKQLLRGRSAVAGVSLLMIAGLLAVQYGVTIIERQRATLAKAAERQREQHQAVLGSAPQDGNAGDQLYYLFFHTAHEPSEWAPAAIGQRDVQPFNLKLRILALQGQLYDSDLSNPLLAAFGSFDLAFVLVLLVPLLVIILSYDVLSGDRERGTWDLIRSQPGHPWGVIALKLFIRMSVILAAVMVLITVAALCLHAPFDGRFAGIVSLTALYLGVWAGTVIFIVALGRSSDFNLIALFAIWLVWSVVGPAFVNVVASMRYPLPEALELTIRQREGYHASWDRPVAEVMQAFYQRYPEWRDHAVPDDQYSNAWYYAMQQRGDDEAASVARAYRDTLDRRRQWTAGMLAFSPPATFQLALNAIARTDLDAHLGYLSSVAEFHERLKRHFFPVIFENHRVRDVRWDDAPRHRFAPAQQPTAPRAYALTLGLTAAVVIAAGGVLLSHEVQRRR